MPTPRYYPPGPRTEPLIRLYDIVYGLMDQASAANNNGNNNSTVTTISVSGGNGGNSVSDVVVGTHADRFSTNATLYIETDRQYAAYANNGAAWVLVDALWQGAFEDRYTGLGSADNGAYWTEISRNNIAAIPPLLIHRWDGNNWAYQEGQISRNQSDLSTLFATLVPSDGNMLIHVPDYRHQLQWDGNNNNTTWGPNDDGRAGEGPILREIDPSPTTGWKLYDGNNATYLLANGNTAVVTLPDLTSNNSVAAYLKAARNNTGPNAAVAPTFTGNNLTPAGTIAANFSGTADNTGTPSGTSTFLGAAVGVSVTVASNNHDHTYTPSGNVTATFSGNAVTPSGNVSATGEPRNLTRRPWFRQ